MTTMDLRTATVLTWSPTRSPQCSVVSCWAEHRADEQVKDHSLQQQVSVAPKQSNCVGWADVAVAAAQYPVQKLDLALVGRGVGDKVDQHASVARQTQIDHAILGPVEH